MDHVNKRQITEYILSGEFPIDESSAEIICQHLEQCAECKSMYNEMKSRHDSLKLPDPMEHIKNLNQRAEKINKIRRMTTAVFRAAAVIFFTLIGYGSASWYLNRSFDHGETGLADLEADRIFAMKTTVYRGEEIKIREDIELFKTGVLILFDSKRTRYGLFPYYDPDMTDQAADFFSRAERITGDEILKGKISVFKDRIERIKKVKKEIKK